MDKSELAKRLMATFIDELQEHVESMSNHLIELESEPSSRSDLIHELFRSAHSLKGAARAVNADPLQRLCHAMEDILAAVRNGVYPFSHDAANCMLKAVDCIDYAGTNLREKQPLDVSTIDQTIELLNAVATASKTGGLAPVVEPVAIVETVEESVQQVPADQDESVVEQAKPSPEPLAPVPRAATGSSTTIRVTSDKLDRLLAQSGEVLLARRRVESRTGDAIAVQETAALLRNDWRYLDQLLRRLRHKTKTTTFVDTDTQQAVNILDKTATRLQSLVKDIDNLTSGMASDSRTLRQSCSALDDEVYRVRMLPFSESCGGLKRTVRDVCQATGKEVELTIIGGSVEVDRSVLDAVKNPLMHLVRNAIDHGMESPNDRVAQGKRRAGRVVVDAQLRGGLVEISVEDDGRGLDLEKICNKARQQGIEVPSDPMEQARLIFAPGFSTATKVSEISGRGVGLDVVLAEVEALHGTVGIHTGGSGVRFTMTVPLTLTKMRAMILQTAGGLYAVPTTSVWKVVRFRVSELKSVAGRDTFMLADSPIPVIELTSILQSGSAKAASEDQARLGIVMKCNDAAALIVVDEILSEQDVLIRNLGRRIHRIKHFSGATLLTSGKVALVINSPQLVRTALGIELGPTLIRPMDEAAVDVGRRLLVVDDSMTTRTLIKTILESTGYEVSVASDGLLAWQQLNSASFDLVVSDVDMPNMNGFELTETIRDSTAHCNLPVILVTARSSDIDKTRGLKAGANAYIEKGGFDQQALVDKIRQLI